MVASATWFWAIDGFRSTASSSSTRGSLSCRSSFESFDSLYTGRGLPTDRVVELLIETAERALYA